MQEQNDLGIYEMYEENRKMFDSIRRQLLVFEQKEKENQKKSKLSIKEILKDLFTSQ